MDETNVAALRVLKRPASHVSGPPKKKLKAKSFGHRTTSATRSFETPRPPSTTSFRGEFTRGGRGSFRESSSGRGKGSFRNPS